MKRFFTLALSLILTATCTLAQESHLRANFDFETVNSEGVYDPLSKVTAKLMNKATVEEQGTGHVLNLGTQNGYLNLTRAFGRELYGLDEFTISSNYYVDPKADITANGNFLWMFSSVQTGGESSGKYIAYRLNVQRFASATAGFASEVGMDMGQKSIQGRWVNVIYRQKNGRGELLINGQVVNKVSGIPKPSEVYDGSAPTFCWIGRSPFSGDVYLSQTLVDDIRLYDVSIDSQTARQLAKAASDKQLDYMYGTTGDFTSLKQTVADAKALLAVAEAGNYAPAAVTNLSAGIEAAEKEIALGKASQNYIDDIQAELANLVKKVNASKGFTSFTPMEFTAGQQGFVHPGALVTQADIDRAKKLIFEDKNEYMVRAWQILCDNQWSQAGVATWPTPTVHRAGSGDNYMNAARAAHAAYQNALRWKISGDRAHADTSVGIMMNWCNVTTAVTGNTNVSLAAGLYGYEFANAAELMRDYDGWAREDFERFKEWMVRVWYNPAIDFLRRRHDTWMNFRYPSIGERPGHYWSNWGLCNVLCVMSIGILCDDVHMYNQGVSFYKYDHQGTFVADRSTQPMIYNDGCDEFIGNLVPDVLPDERGPFGYLGQMQESGRDQGHAVMALGCALDICQIGFNQGDDLFAYMDDRIAAGTEFVAAMNFGGVAGTDLPWHPYEYADCRGVRGSSWQMYGPSDAGLGERRPIWDRVRGYYEGLRGVPMQYSDAAAAVLCPDGGGGNYNAQSGGYDHLGFSSLTHWRPLIDKADAITPLSGDIIYKGETLKNQTNLGGLKYKYLRGSTFAIPADGAEITLIPQLPEGVEDTGLWKWETGETTRQITVHADHSYIYRVTYTAANGRQSQQSFDIAVAGDAEPDPMRTQVTVGGEVEQATDVSVLSGSDLILFAEATTGWTDEYLWDDGTKSTTTTVQNVTTDRSYTCQYRNQSGAVSEAVFNIHVLDAIPHITVDGYMTNQTEAEVFQGTEVTLSLELPIVADPQNVTWQDGSHGSAYTFTAESEPVTCTATYLGQDYVFHITTKDADFSYFTDYLTHDNGYTLVQSPEQLDELLASHYFVICSDEADLMLGLANAPQNGNKGMFYQQPCSPLTDASKFFTIEPFDGGYCLRNIDYDGLTLQTEWDRPWNFRTNDQPLPCSWSRFIFANDGTAWTIENGTYRGNWLGLWFPENGYVDGQEMACNKTVDEEIGHFQIFAIPRARLHADLLSGATEATPVDATVLIQNPAFDGLNWALWSVEGTFGNQRFNGAAETWHSTGFRMQQVMEEMPAGRYTVSVQMVNGEGSNTGYLSAWTSESSEKKIVTQSCAGSNFDAERDKMARTASYALLSCDVEVGTDGMLHFGIFEPTDGTTWLVFDNFRLTYHGSVDTAIGSIEDGKMKMDDANAIYDLSGRRISADDPRSLTKGLYIINGKKTLIR